MLVLFLNNYELVNAGKCIIGFYSMFTEIGMNYFLVTEIKFSVRRLTLLFQKPIALL